MPKKKILEVEVKRETWLTGEFVKETNYSSKLLQEETGFMCCLGFVCRQAKIPKHALADRGTLVTLAYKYFAKLRHLGLLNPLNDHTQRADEAMGINDRPGLDRRVREARIKRVLSEIGISIRFTGRYPNYKKLNEELSK
jgi:hypothetical protein